MTPPRNGTSRTASMRRRSGLVAGAAAIAGVIGLLASGPALAADVETVAAASQNPRVERRPNVVIVMADDVGFSMTSAFGGPVPAPNIERLAREGIRFNRFNTTAQCSPTRAALLTGRNPHRVQVGSIVNTAGPEAGYTSIIPTTAATIGKVMSLQGYATGWIGKGHITPVKDIQAGITDRWPNGLGFNYYYGMLGGATDQFRPVLIENTTKLPVRKEPEAGYILEQDLTTHAIDWYRGVRKADPAKPFLLYYASGAVHAPQQAPAEWIARFRGKFDKGWDEIRKETFARQKRDGVVPAGAVLTPRPVALPAWESLTPEKKRLAARMMEVAAAQEAFFDDQLGRLLAAIEADGIEDNTLVVFINGDNGASQEGAPDGTISRGRQITAPSIDVIDQFGSAAFPVLYNAGWAWAMNTPFQYYKHMASHLGGVRNGLIVKWPGHVSEPGSVRQQYGFVTDIAATVYEATRTDVPKVVDGAEQMPLDGISLLYSFKDAAAPSRRREQYIENNGNRSFYRDGWLASTVPPKQLWEKGVFPPVETWEWQLYDLGRDFSQARNLSAKYPKKLEDLRSAYAAAEKANGFTTRQTPDRPGD